MSGIVKRKAFPTVHFEIVGSCNARCPYCVTGSKNQPKGALVGVEVFEKALARLLEYGLFDREKSVLYLYNWGEPFLHPKFHELIEIVNKFDIKYGISTNASIVPEIDEAIARNLTTIMFSMPGFSQKSYDRIHGFDFEMIKNNITRLVKELRVNRFKGATVILFHIYQFNLHEMKDCENFADNLGMTFSPYYAGVNDWWRMKALMDGTLSFDEMKKLSRDLFLYHFWDKVSKPPRKTCRYFDEYFMLDEHANVTTCCVLPANHPDYSCGNILTDNIEEILKKKVTMPICKECMDSGLSNKFVAVCLPDFYQYNVKHTGTLGNLKKIVRKITG